MPMKPGASDSETGYSDSLAEAIENAFKMEWMAAKGETLPEAGASERRILFAAIAQGLLDYLKDNEAYFKNIFINIGMPQIIRIDSPHIELDPSSGGSSTSVTVRGIFFERDQTVTVTWDDPKNEYQFEVDDNGTFENTVTPPDQAESGRHIVEARDEYGHVALAMFTKY